ncbi:hypothetical protein [Pseudomonas phage D6]|nr:hypothetical protein [Pseudomonas phage D6]
MKVSFPGNLTKFDNSIIDTIRRDAQPHSNKAGEYLKDGFKPVNEVIHYLYQHGWEQDPKKADEFLKTVDFEFKLKADHIQIAKPNVEHELPALDTKSIKAVAQTFLDLVELKRELWDKHLMQVWKTFGVEGRHYSQGGKRYKEAEVTNAPHSVYRLFEELHDYGYKLEEFLYEFNSSYTEITVPTADGLLRWMNRSIAQK